MTHCVLPSREDPFGVAHVLRGTPFGKNTIVNFRNLPAVSYVEMTDFDLQQKMSADAGLTRRIISSPFAAEAITQVSSTPAIDAVTANSAYPRAIQKMNDTYMVPMSLAIFIAQLSETKSPQ